MTGAGPTDCVVVGASFAGLACASALAQSGARVAVIDKKCDVGTKLHTTGILVKDAIDQIALLDALPADMVRRVDGVRLYAPNMRHIDLAAPGYYFLTTDTPRVMRWLADQTQRDGATLALGTLFRGATRTQAGFDIEGFGAARTLVGADGPTSAVARALGLGRNAEFLFGIEHEYDGQRLAEPDRLHCFVDRGLARGYIGWVVAGPNATQVGLAHRVRPGARPAANAIEPFLAKIASVVDLRHDKPMAVRAGLIPCGGLVSPVATRRALLVGDAAGMVSPVTAGGIHTALKHGLAAGHAIADFLAGRRDDPSTWFVASYPRFRGKRALRFLFDRFQSDLLFNAMLTTPLLRQAAGIVYFHHKGVFDPPTAARTGVSHANPDGPRAIDRAGVGRG